MSNKHFDHSWNKGDRRVTQLWEKAKKQDAPTEAAKPAHTSVLLSKVLSTPAKIYTGGALEHTADGVLRRNEKTTAPPELGMSQPPPRPLAPTARVTPAVTVQWTPL
jgi:hypothetical protein